ncbi:zinc finger protein 708 [Condylostylus longicornis]|uniref:zinc finger protein 708 n=1 Tax=Condylostylus longicornis TaxID=2530218 RepID=UPI00244E2C3F|nr:zinc finger protein 708 [Condylostylus longicornis]
MENESLPSEVPGKNEVKLESYENIILYVCSLCLRSHHSSLGNLREHMIKDHGCRVRKDIKRRCLEKLKVKKPNPEDLVPVVGFKDFKTILKKSCTFKCPLKGCSFSFDSEEKQETHFRCHTTDDPNKLTDFKCFDCGQETKTWRNCSNHMWSDHEIDVDLLSCPICSFKAMTCVKVWKHMKIHKKWTNKVLESSNRKRNSKPKKLINNKKYYSQKVCEICNRVFVNGKTLSKHIKAVHNKIKPFICRVCGLKLARKSTWLIHQRQHTDEKLQCKYCDFKARDPSVIYKHELRHKQIKPYKCKLCNYSSIQTKTYKSHLKYYHPEEYKKIACDQCNYVTITEEKLEAHKKDHKKGLVVNEDSADVTGIFKNPQKFYNQEKSINNIELSSDCFLPLESIDSIQHDDTGGVTIPALSEDTQFPNF